MQHTPDSAPPQRLVPQRLPQPGDLLQNTYRIVRVIGEGTFGIVYEAEQPALARRVAIKVLKPDMLVVPGIVERFMREARLAAALSSRHTATIYDVGAWSCPPWPELPWIAMEHLVGCSLDAWLEQRGPLPIKEACALLTEVLHSLAEAHSRGIVHRDLKPENIFIAETGEGVAVKILDFGIARAVTADWSESARARLTQAGALCGTPAFMAPEQAMGTEEVSAATDVYAVGCVAFLMLTGRLPYDSTSTGHLLVAHLQRAIPELPEPLAGSPIAQVVRQAMSKGAEDRFPNAAAFAEQLQRATRATDPKLLALRCPTPVPAPASALDSAPALRVAATEPAAATPERPHRFLQKRPGLLPILVAIAIAVVLVVGALVFNAVSAADTAPRSTAQRLDLLRCACSATTDAAN